MCWGQLIPPGTLWCNNNKKKKNTNALPPPTSPFLNAHHVVTTLSQVQSIAQTRVCSIRWYQRFKVQTCCPFSAWGERKQLCFFAKIKQEAILPHTFISLGFYVKLFILFLKMFTPESFFSFISILNNKKLLLHPRDFFFTFQIL